MSGFRGEFPLKACGTDWVLRFDFNALAFFEERSGIPALQFMTDMEKAGAVPRISDLRLMLWAGLQRHHSDVPIETAGDILSENPQAIIEGMTRAMPAQSPADPGVAPQGK